jgi:hypothetical protein
MATFTAFPSRKCYRVRYTLTLDTIKKRRAKYAPERDLIFGPVSV